MLKAEVMKYLLDEAIVRVEEINKFNKKYGNASDALEENAKLKKALLESAGY